MTQIILDASVCIKLNDLTQPVELCDPAGRVLGRFVPLIDMSQWEPISPDVSEEELDRREQETESYTTSEVLAHLENLKCSRGPMEAIRIERVDEPVDASRLGWPTSNHGSESHHRPAIGN